MEMQKIIELSNDYYFIISDGKIYVSEGYCSDIKLGEEFFDLTTINERPKGKWVRDHQYRCSCSICGGAGVDNYKYCKDCGAEMEVK